MLAYLKAYIQFTKATARSEYFAYKSRFLLWAFSNAISFIAQLFLWKAVYANTSVEMINGYSVNDMMYYLCVSRIVECFSFVSVEAYVAKGIKDGQIAIDLIRPVNYKCELLFRALGQIIGSVVLFLPVYLILFAFFTVFNRFKVLVDPSTVVLGVILTVLAFLLNFVISLLVSCLIFKTTKHTGVYMMKKTAIAFLSGAMLPISFYPDIVQKVIRYAPFAYLRYYPISAFLGKTDGIYMYDVFIRGLLWLVFLIICLRIIWARSIKKMLVFGG